LPQHFFGDIGSGEGTHEAETDFGEGQPAEFFEFVWSVAGDLRRHVETTVGRETTEDRAAQRGEWCLAGGASISHDLSSAWSAVVCSVVRLGLQRQVLEVYVETEKSNTRRMAGLHRRADIVKAGALVGIPMLMVLAQPDLGTALTYMPIAIMGLFLGGMKSKHALVIVLIAALLAPVGWHVLKPYQRDRLTTFIEPEADPQHRGYQLIQSLVAVGSGGIFGKGTAQGSQTQGQFLPVPHTDFIFAAFAEEHGFIGAMGLLLLYFIVLMRLIQNAQTAPDRAGAFVVMGVVAVLAFHILVNVGMVVGFMPVTGIPLPLMSYGGSSVLFMFLALGIVMNVRMRRFVN